MSNRDKIIFDWNADEIQALFDSCSRDTATPFIEKYIARNGLVIEAGCGTARFVNYLLAKGWKQVVGLEYSVETLRMAHAKNSRMPLVAADILHFPFEDATVSGIISLGVIEHFIAGPDAALREMHRVLSDDGLAVVTVPSLNLVRRIKYPIKDFIMGLKKNARLRQLIRKTPLESNASPMETTRYRYYVYPDREHFFEYRLKKIEFERVLERNGFKVVVSAPICQMDGYYHEFGPRWVQFRNWRFYPSLPGRLMNGLLSQFPFAHNHMHLCVVKKKIDVEKA